MDCCFGVVGKDFIMLASDQTVARSILKLKENEEKIMLIDNDKLLALSGEAPDRLQFGDYIQKNINLYKYKNGTNLSTKETANYIRSELAYAIRNGPYAVNVLVAGIDEEGPGLYYIDYLGTMQQTTKSAHGYCSYFVYSILDNLYKPDLSVEEATKIIKYCINEMNTRFLVGLKNFTVKIVRKDGVENIDLKL